MDMEASKGESRMIPTYDDRQLGAVLVRCTVCAREYFMTAPQEICIRCRRAWTASGDSTLGIYRADRQGDK